MAKTNNLIRKLLRLITPEEITEIATKHSEGGRIVAMTEIIKERVLKKVYRDFTTVDAIEEIIDAQNARIAKEFKAQGFNRAPLSEFEEAQLMRDQKIQEESALAKISPSINIQMRAVSQEKAQEDYIELNGHIKSDPAVENMSSFIINEKERLKKSQATLKQKEILNLYEKNSNIDVAEVKIENKNPGSIGHKGILINKKQ